MGTWYASALPVQSCRPARTSSSLINWLVVTWTGGAAFLLIAGLVLTILFTERHTQALRRASSSSPVAVVPATILEKKTAPAVGATANSSESIAAQEKAFETKASVPQKVASQPAAPIAEQSLAKIAQLPSSEQCLTDGEVIFENYGTQVSFAPSPAEAARQAAKERKLLFTLHIAGNFEESRFT